MKRATIPILTVLSVFLIMVAAESLQWRMAHDTPWCLYIARLIGEHGYLPYRDIHEIDFPGTYFVHILIGRLIGYTSDFGLRVFDIAFLGLISWGTWAWRSQHGKLGTWAAIILFGIAYLGSGDGTIMQRDYLLLLPVIGGAALADLPNGLPKWVKALLAGLLFSFAGTIKPNAVIGLPVALLAILWQDEQTEAFWKSPKSLTVIGMGAIGAAMPVAIIVGYLVGNNLVQDFIETVVKYAPLYSTISHTLIAIDGPERIGYVVGTWIQFNGYWAWLVAGIASAVVLLRIGKSLPRVRRDTLLQIGYAAAYAISPALSGRFLSYHWLTFLYFIIVLAAACIDHLPSLSQRRWQVAAAIPILVASILAPGMAQSHVQSLASRYINGIVPIQSEVNTADQIAGYFNGRLQAGQRIQLLDFGQGGMHGMLMLDALPATEYVTSQRFFHHVSDPYVQGTRRDFIDQLIAARPAYVVDVTSQLIITGPDASREFPELAEFLSANYAPVFAGHGFIVYRLTRLTDQALIIYPARPDEVRPYFRAANDQDIATWMPDEVSDRAAVDSALEDLASDHRIMRVQFVTGQADPGHVFETWLNHHAFKLPEEWIGGTRVLTYLDGGATCNQAETVGVEFGGIIRLAEAQAALTDTEGTSALCVRLQWEASQPIDQSFKVAVHIVGADGTLIAQYDGIPDGYLMPTTAWQPDQTVIDQFAIPLPGGADQTDFEIRVIVYNEASGERLTVESGDYWVLPH